MPEFQVTRTEVPQVRAVSDGPFLFSGADVAAVEEQFRARKVQEVPGRAVTETLEIGGLVFQRNYWVAEGKEPPIRSFFIHVLPDGQEIWMNDEGTWGIGDDDSIATFGRGSKDGEAEADLLRFLKARAEERGDHV